MTASDAGGAGSRGPAIEPSRIRGSIAAWAAIREIALAASPAKATKLLHRLVGPPMRKAILAIGDPALQRKVQGVEMLLPYSHELPNYAAEYPFYETALPAFASFLADELRRPVSIVDVGANVGDTVAMLGAAVGSGRLACLCIEADPACLPLLRLNTRGLDVRIVNAVLGAESGEHDLSVVPTGKGSAVMVSTGDTTSVSTLDALAEGLSPDLIKTDTDGFEIEVLKGARRLLARTQASLFAEYSPGHLRRVGKADPFEFFRIVREAGYESVIAYDNEGYPLTLSSLDAPALDSLMRYCELKPYLYFDMLFAKDAGLLTRFYAHDLARYQDQRHLRRYRGFEA